MIFDPFPELFQGIQPSFLGHSPLDYLLDAEIKGQKVTGGVWHSILLLKLITLLLIFLQNLKTDKSKYFALT